MTNAEKIRSMTDEELAVFLSNLPFAFDEHLWTYPSVNGKWYRDQDKAIKDNLDWLKSEVEE